MRRTARSAHAASAARLGQHPLHRPTRRFRLAAAGRARQFPTRGGANRTSPAVYTADAWQASSAFPITANMEILGSLPVACKRLAEDQLRAGPGSRIGFCSHRIACGLDASRLSVVATPRGGDSVGESYGLAHLQQFPDEIPCGQQVRRQASTSTSNLSQCLASRTQAPVRSGDSVRPSAVPSSPLAARCGVPSCARPAPPRAAVARRRQSCR